MFSQDDESGVPTFPLQDREADSFDLPCEATILLLHEGALQRGSFQEVSQHLLCVVSDSSEVKMKY